MSIISFIDSDGVMRWGIRHVMEMPISSTVGLLEMAKLEMIAQCSGAVTNLSIESDGDDGN
jgi:hypothetical protein